MELLVILAGIIGVVGILVFVFFYGALSWGYVTYLFYSWFILPILGFMPHITYWQAVGLFCFFSLMKNHTSNSIKKEYKDESKDWIALIVAPWTTLLIGWIIHSL